MKWKKLSCLCFIVGSLVVFSACSSEEKKDGNKAEQKQEEKGTEYFSGELTKEERQGTHLSLELADKLSVDADITSETEFEEEINSYCIGEKKGGKAIGKATEYKNNKFFNEIKQKIIEKDKGTFSKKTHLTYKKGNFINLSVPYTASDGTKKMLSCYSELDKKNRMGEVYFSFIRYDTKDTKNPDAAEYINEQYIGENMRQIFPECDMSDLSFGGQEEIAEQLREDMEDATGMKLAKLYECMPVSFENYRLVKEQFFQDSNLTKNEEEYYTFFFYPELDGLPWIAAGMQEETAGKKNSAMKESIMSLDEVEQTISYGRNGIRGFDLSKRVEVLEVYQKEKICGLDTVLEQIKAYFQEDSVMIPTLVYQIQLCYSGAFERKEDGSLQNIVKPFWYVEYWKQCWDGKRCGKIWFDAETGECVSQIKP